MNIKNSLTRTFIFLISILLVPVILNAQQSPSQNLSFTCSYPSPLGSYTRLLLEPRDDTGLACDADNEGLFYVKNNVIPHQLQICLNDGTNFQWESVSRTSSGVWTKSGVNIYPSDTSTAITTNTDNRLGIGVLVPQSTLQVQTNPIASSSAQIAELRLKTNRPRSSSQIVFEDAEDPNPQRPFRIKYHSQDGDNANPMDNTPSYGAERNNDPEANNWLEFWGYQDSPQVSGLAKLDKPIPLTGLGSVNIPHPILTMQRDYNPPRNHWAGVGIGVPEYFNVRATLEVRKRNTPDPFLALPASGGGLGSEDILHLMTRNMLLFNVNRYGKVSIGPDLTQYNLVTESANANTAALNQARVEITPKLAANAPNPGVAENALRIFSSSSVQTLLVTDIGQVVIGSTTAPVATDLLTVQGNSRVNGSIQLAPVAAAPTCTVATRGTIWFNNAAAGIADSISVCRKDASNNYGWSNIPLP